VLDRNDAHEYSWYGEHVPGVNELLRELGMIDTTFFTEEGAARGKRRHSLLEAYDENRIDWAKIEPEDGYVLVGWREFLEDSGFLVKSNELPVIHSGLWYAGTIDKVGTLDGQTHLLDIKSGSSVDRWAYLQTACYALAYADTFSVDVPRMSVVHIRQAKKKQYSHKPVPTHYLDLAVSLVTTYHMKMKNWERVDKIAKSKADWVDVLAKELDDGQDKS